MEPALPAGVSVGFAALDGAGIRWAVLREAAPAHAGGEVDVIVSPEDADAARAALEAVGFIERRSWGYVPHRFFLRAAHDGWATIDMVTALRFGPRAVHVPALDGALARAVREGALPRLHPADGFFALLLHVLLDKRAVDERHARTLELLAPAALDSAVARSLFASTAGAETVIRAAADGRWDQAASWARSLRGGSPAGSAARAFAKRVGWRLTPLRRRGLTVALLAPDGAGKTTLIAALARTFPIPVRTIYMGLYRNPRRRLPPGVGLASRLALQWLRYARAAYHRRRGRVVLFDRYTDDASIAERAAGARDRLRRRLLVRVVPRPDLLVVLDAPAEELFRRKGEHDLAILERARAHYLNVAERSPGAVVLDATRQPDEIARAVAVRIWAALAVRS